MGMTAFCIVLSGNHSVMSMKSAKSRRRVLLSWGRALIDAPMLLQALENTPDNV